MFPRSSGILLHPSSLYGKYGIGTLGNSAIEFINFLSRSNQKLWQVFPLGPTGYGDSPYQSFSAFAGNPYLIDLETLIDSGLLQTEDADEAELGDDPENVDYGLLYKNKLPLLRKAYENYKKSDNEQMKFEIQIFKDENSFWLEDYSLFISLKYYFKGYEWSKWDEDILLRKESALKKYRKLLKDDIEYNYFVQYLFFNQWAKIKGYANSKGISIIGDIPIFVAFDSADAWANPEIFLFDKERKPIDVAGVPPDYFSETGQLWGNPLFDWEKLKGSGYKWWIERVRANLKTADIIRIDHFRGFESYWAVPAEEKTAVIGEWRKGPGIDFFNSIKAALGDLPIIAEDLGNLTNEVVELRNETGFPGMKILQFAFDSDEENDYLTHSYNHNCVVYTGTHDNDTITGWYSKASEHDKEYVRDYLDIYTDNEINWRFIKAAWRSVANMALAPMQDFLGLDSEARMNTPGVAAGNWKWRMKEEDLTTVLSDEIKRISKLYGR
ncbi:4-alpha-glucanotransferase [Sebaldella sp. S0638]|uniref:4-alpha-glucanotransferase n=1 Tax=Sebaldella sp. S0638 TaxID=2957809 RepID=UPI00209C7BF1|nr:4-alpha-glucanotransferase [Sebaldella sp. S0638]MCP1224655.1 4-alpha-glucanotransferase [Sebaldella sp. S0638]